MSTYDPHGALQKVPFVQYLSGAELFSFARTLERVTVAEGALLLPPPYSCPTDADAASTPYTLHSSPGYQRGPVLIAWQVGRLASWLRGHTSIQSCLPSRIYQSPTCMENIA
jgi:hypothetical protein